MQKNLINPREKIPETIVLEKPLFQKPMSISEHPRFCRCIDCRTYYDEDLELCASPNCVYPPYSDCDKKYCIKHHEKNCDFETA